MAPEVLADGDVSTEADVWSFAVLVWELFAHGAAPYAGGTHHTHACMYALSLLLMMSQWLATILPQCWHLDAD